MIDIWQKLASTKRPIVLYGMGNGAEIMMKQLNKYGIEVSGFFASDDFVRGQSFLGYRVMTFREIKEKFPDMIALISFGTQRKEVIENILSLDCEVYAPEVPVVGDNVFTLDFAKEHKAEIEKVYSLLADDFSKKVFEEVILYKLDGKISHLINCQSEDSLEIFDFNENEKYLDLGAYNGDTVLEFVNKTKQYDSIVAVEPDVKNFKKLQKNTEHLKNITLINKAVSEISGTVKFSTAGGRNSRIGGETEILSTSVDDLKTDFTFIKMDVEGQEAAAIKGAVNTILKKPKMLISAYHRSEDIFKIPLLVHDINPEYRVFLRHLPYIPAWDTNYCFI